MTHILSGKDLLLDKQVPGTHSRQFIAASAEVSPNGSLGSGNPTQNGLNSG